MSAPSSLAPRLSLLLPLCALLAAGGCSSTADTLGPASGYADGGSYEGGESGGGDSDGDPMGADSDGGNDGGSDGSGGPEPIPEPDDGGRNETPEEPPSACDLETNVSLYLSPDDSNSMSSPVRAREAVLGGWGTVQSVAIRTWEFFNYYDFGYPAAEPGTLVLSPSMRPVPNTAGTDYLLQIGVSSEAITAEMRAPVNVTLVLDTSGSMEGEPMELLKESCYAIASSLKSGDVISMVTWNTTNAVLMGGYQVEGPNDPTLLAKIESLSASGGTDLDAGLSAGYQLAQASFASDRINRVVLVSDGGANAGVTDIELIAQHSSAGNDQSIYLVGVGVGDAATYHDDLMDAVTDAGKGASVFIASSDEAWSTFHDDFISTMAIAARDVQLRLEMPPGFEIVSTSAEELSADASEVEPQHLAPNDAMVFHQHVRTCAPQLASNDATVTVTVIWIDAVTFQPRQLQRVVSVGELLGADPAPLLKGAAVFAYAEGLKAYKVADADGRVATMVGAFAALERAEAVLPGDPELAEIREVLEALAQ